MKYSELKGNKPKKRKVSFPNYWLENAGQDKPILKERNGRTRIMHKTNICSFIKIYEETQTLWLYWFAAQQQTSRSRRQRFSLFYQKLSVKFNQLSLWVQTQQEVVKKWLKLK